MSRVDFAFGAPDRMVMACQVARKRYDAGERLVVYCSDQRRLAAFDRLLWTFDDIAFIPHAAGDDPSADATPVVLTPQAPDALLRDAAAEAESPTWLLNLDDACPPAYTRFMRVMEIVSDADDDKLAARQRWRTYAAAGDDVRSHKIGATA